LAAEASLSSSSSSKSSLLETLARELSSVENDTDDKDPLMARLDVLRKRLPLGLNRTIVAPSSLSGGAGRGLFAVRDCQKGDVLTCYPGDALLETPQDGDWTIRWGDHIAPQHQLSLDDLDETLISGYIVFVDEDYGVLGLPDYDDDTSYLGHFANDGATMPTREMELSSYMLESNERQNAMHRSIGVGDDDVGGCHMITVATRNIKAGGEIFVTYGPEYWREQPSFTNNDDDDDGTFEMMFPVDGKSAPSNGKGFG
jgi:hypothetical protein